MTPVQHASSSSRWIWGCNNESRADWNLWIDCSWEGTEFLLLSVSLMLLLFLNVVSCANRAMALQRRTWNAHSLARRLSLTASRARDSLLLCLRWLWAHKCFHFFAFPLPVPYHGYYDESFSNTLSLNITSLTPLNRLVHSLDHQPRCQWPHRRMGSLYEWGGILAAAPLAGIITSRITRMWVLMSQFLGDAALWPHQKKGELYTYRAKSRTYVDNTMYIRE